MLGKTASMGLVKKTNYIRRKNVVFAISLLAIFLLSQQSLAVIKFSQDINTLVSASNEIINTLNGIPGISPADRAKAASISDVFEIDTIKSSKDANRISLLHNEFSHSDLYDDYNDIFAPEITLSGYDHTRKGSRVLKLRWAATDQNPANCTIIVETENPETNEYIGSVVQTSSWGSGIPITYTQEYQPGNYRVYAEFKDMGNQTAVSDVSHITIIPLDFPIEVTYLGVDYLTLGSKYPYKPPYNLIWNINGGTASGGGSYQITRELFLKDPGSWYVRRFQNNNGHWEHDSSGKGVNISLLNLRNYVGVAKYTLVVTNFYGIQTTHVKFITTTREVAQPTIELQNLVLPAGDRYARLNWDISGLQTPNGIYVLSQVQLNPMPSDSTPYLPEIVSNGTWSKSVGSIAYVSEALEPGVYKYVLEISEVSKIVTTAYVTVGKAVSPEITFSHKLTYEANTTLPLKLAWDVKNVGTGSYVIYKKALGNTSSSTTTLIKNGTHSFNGKFEFVFPGLSLGFHRIEFHVTNEFGLTDSITRYFELFDLAPPTVSQLEDIDVLGTTTDKNVQWVVNDDTPCNYTIYLNYIDSKLNPVREKIQAGKLFSNTINFALDFRTLDGIQISTSLLRSYQLELKVSDSAGMTATDLVSIKSGIKTTDGRVWNVLNEHRSHLDAKNGKRLIYVPSFDYLPNQLHFGGNYFGVNIGAGIDFKVGNDEVQFTNLGWPRINNLRNGPVTQIQRSEGDEFLLDFEFKMEHDERLAVMVYPFNASEYSVVSNPVAINPEYSETQSESMTDRIDVTKHSYIIRYDAENENPTFKRNNGYQSVNLKISNLDADTPYYLLFTTLIPLSKLERFYGPSHYWHTDDPLFYRPSFSLRDVDARSTDLSRLLVYVHGENSHGDIWKPFNSMAFSGTSYYDVKLKPDLYRAFEPHQGIGWGNYTYAVNKTGRDFFSFIKRLQHDQFGYIGENDTQYEFVTVNVPKDADTLSSRLFTLLILQLNKMNKDVEIDFITHSVGSMVTKTMIKDFTDEGRINTEGLLAKSAVIKNVFSIAGANFGVAFPHAITADAFTSIGPTDLQTEFRQLAINVPNPWIFSHFPRNPSDYLGEIDWHTIRSRLTVERAYTPYDIVLRKAYSLAHITDHDGFLPLDIQQFGVFNYSKNWKTDYLLPDDDFNHHFDVLWNENAAERVYEILIGKKGSTSHYYRQAGLSYTGLPYNIQFVYKLFDFLELYPDCLSLDYGDTFIKSSLGNSIGLLPPVCFNTAVGWFHGIYMPRIYTFLNTEQDFFKKWEYGIFATIFSRSPDFLEFDFTNYLSAFEDIFDTLLVLPLHGIFGIDDVFDSFSHLRVLVTAISPMILTLFTEEKDE